MRRGPTSLRQTEIEGNDGTATSAGLATPEKDIVRVFLVGDVRLHRELLAAALEAESGVEIAGTAHGDVACIAVEMSEANVVLVDGSSPGGATLIRSLVAAAPHAKVVAMGVADDEDRVVELVEAGIAGYATADQALADVVAAVVAATDGELQCSPRISAALAARVTALASASGTSNGDTLTPREREIAALISEGLSNKQIARRLSIEHATVKNHVHNILRKAGVSRRDQISI